MFKLRVQPRGTDQSCPTTLHHLSWPFQTQDQPPGPLSRYGYFVGDCLSSTLTLRLYFMLIRTMLPKLWRFSDDVLGVDSKLCLELVLSLRI